MLYVVASTHYEEDEPFVLGVYKSLDLAINYTFMHIARIMGHDININDDNKYILNELKKYNYYNDGDSCYIITEHIVIDR